MFNTTTIKTNTSKTVTLKLIALAIVIISAFAVQTGEAKAASYLTADLQVTYNSGGRNYALPGATVIFKKNGRETARKTTDRNGWIRVSALRGTYFQVDISKSQGRCGWPYMIYWGRSYGWNVPTGGSSVQRFTLPVNYYGAIC